MISSSAFKKTAQAVHELACKLSGITEHEGDPTSIYARTKVETASQLLKDLPLLDDSTLNEFRIKVLTMIKFAISHYHAKSQIDIGYKQRIVDLIENCLASACRRQSRN